MAPGPARPLTVGITADRRGEEQAVMFRRAGFDVVHGPMMATLPLPDDAPLRAATEALISAPPDYLVASTGLGMRSWWAKVDQWGLAPPLLAALSSHTRVVSRGPKATGATRLIGLPVWWRAPDEQLSGVARHLLGEGVGGRTVAVQLHGTEHGELGAPLRAAGAAVVELPVYQWALPAEQAPALALIEGCCGGEVDAVTFTAGPQVRNLMALAAGAGLAGDFTAACAGPDLMVACIGPVCAAVAATEGLGDVAVPEHWRLGSLVRMVADHLGTRRPDPAPSEA
ncbi:MAG: uroporphyrinogen-III synthase [Acidimicrobiales bacterium]